VRNNPESSRTARRLLVLDSSYALEAIQQKHLEYSVLCRDLSGYFDKVWSVHPFATLVTSESWRPRCGAPESTTLSPRHVFIEGKIGRFRALAPFSILNFALAQAQLLTQLVALVFQQRISVIRAGDPLLLGLYGWLLARLCRIPLVIRVSGNNEKWRQETGRPVMPRLLRFPAVERAIERFVLSRADLVAAPNEENLQYAISMGARKDMATVFRYGNLLHPIHFVDPLKRGGEANPVAGLGIRNAPYLLYIGRLEPVKMPHDVIKALTIIRSAGCDVALVIVGGGSLSAELQQLATELHVAEATIFAGERDQQWLGSVIPHAVCVLSPHTGRALTEVALGAAPVVAYDVDWQGELIRSGVTGTLVPVGDVQAMAEAAIAFINAPDAAREIGDRLRASTLDLMNPERLDQHERDQYQRLFERRGGRRPVERPSQPAAT
jgi:glycosyltransferase involved in cell wall biosynthesis